MKKLLSFCFLLLLVSSSLYAAPNDIAQHASCEYCGMNRSKFAHSRMLIKYEDGSSTALCSLHCAAVEFALQVNKMPLALMVGDYGSKHLIDAEQAHWVLGGEHAGVMTRRAKWAFSEQEAAERFVASHGGALISFEQAVKAAYEDMYQDTQMIRKKRLSRRLKDQAGGS